jgi:IS5 family transposase
MQARHGHKSRARTFDGYKSHLSVDPDEELITNVAVTAANTADREVIDDLLEEPTTGAPADAESVAGEHNADNAEGDGSDSQNGSGLDGASVWRGGSAQAWH